MKAMLMMFAISAFLMATNVVHGGDQKLKTYFQTQDFQTLLYTLGVYWDRAVLGLQMTCNGRYRVKPISFGLIEPIRFGSDSVHPDEGIWTVRYRLTRRGESIDRKSVV